MSDEAGDFLSALQPVVEQLGASVVVPSQAMPGDQPVDWRGETVAYVRPGQIHGALERHVAAVERELGDSLAEMTRGQKQAAVRRLDELGVFLLRGAVDDVAGWMGVSKVTLYSYLNAISRTEDH